MTVFTYSFFIIKKQEDGTYHIQSDCSDESSPEVDKTFETKGELIGFIVDSLD